MLIVCRIISGLNFMNSFIQKHDLVEEVMRTMKKEVPNVSFSDASEQHLSAAEIAAARMGSNEANSGKEEEEEELCDHVHHSNRSPWLRALVLGANDGLVSVASLMMGVGAGNADLKVLRLSGVAGLIAGALSMAMGEYVSVSSQRDSEKADIKKEIEEQLKGPAAQARELEELAQIYVSRGIPYDLAKQVAVILTERDVIRAHARDELGIDIDDLSNPWQAAIVSGLCFSAGAAMPLLSASFITDRTIRLVVLALATTVGLYVVCESNDDYIV